MSKATTVAAPPAGTGGTEVTRFNALRHGVLSRYAVLPWEDAGEYAALLAELAAEHAPRGPTEAHLVEELAGILWRKRRLRLAEAAAHRRGLEAALAPHRDTAEAALAHLDTAGRSGLAAEAVRATDADTSADLADIEADEAMTRRALGHLLGPGRGDAYEAALAALREDTRDWWSDVLARARDEPEEEEDEAPAVADAGGLRRFLEAEVLPWFETRRKELANRPLVREQAYGESLAPTGWSGWAATRSTSTASWSAPSPCCCA